MNKQPPLIVPKGIKYLTQWSNFCLPDHPCIIDKKLTGCGFTEFVLTENFNSVLITPRRNLAENKVDQHNPKDNSGNEIIDERVIYYARTDEPDLGIDKDLESKNPKITKEITTSSISIEDFRQDLRDQINRFLFKNQPIKLIVTYDSFRKVKEILQKEYFGISDTFYFVVDEFQSIFTDSRFKPGTEIELLYDLQDLQRVSFVSATPMMEDYLNMLDEFKELPYYELDWESEDPNRIISPEIVAKSCRSINEVAKKIISEFKEGKFQKKTLVDSNGVPIKIIESKELIFYVNSVKNICDIIRQNNLELENTNVICAKTPENAKKIREAFRMSYRDLGRSSKELPKDYKIISGVPTPNKVTGITENKPITFCTKTVYLGADFYSKCARSVVLSDSGTECLAVDITLDLPQIVGRQRDLENPWKNSVEIFFKAGNGVGDISPEEFENILESKTKKTESLLRSWSKADDGEDKHNLAEEFENTVRKENYRRHYVSVNKHAGSDLQPQFNQLVLIAEKRAFDIQKLDYADRFSVFNRIEEVFGSGVMDMSKEISQLVDKINSTGLFTDKMRYCCEWVLEKGNQWITYLPDPFRAYIAALGIELIARYSFRKSYLDEAMIQRGSERVFTVSDLEEVVTGYFKIGEKYTKSQIKSDLKIIYEKLNIPGIPKATDLEKWFDLRPSKITNKETGKRDHGFEIIAIKE